MTLDIYEIFVPMVDFGGRITCNKLSTAKIKFMSSSSLIKLELRVDIIKSFDKWYDRAKGIEWKRVDSRERGRGFCFSMLPRL